MKNQEPNYIATVSGDYFTRNNFTSDMVIRSFGPFPVKLFRWTKALSLVRFHIMPAILRNADPNFQQIRTCHILSIKNTDGTPTDGLPLKYMGREQLTKYIADRNLPIDSNMYDDITQLRKRIQFAKSNPQKFIEDEQKQRQDYEQKAQTLSANKALLDSTRGMFKPAGANVSSPPITNTNTNNNTAPAPPIDNVHSLKPTEDETKLARQSGGYIPSFRVHNPKPTEDEMKQPVEDIDIDF